MNRILKSTTHLIFIFLIVAFCSCQKESFKNDTTTGITKSKVLKKQTRAFKSSFKTWYMFVPDIANGWVAPNPGPAWYPGGGEGNSTHLGNCYTYFNQYATIGENGFSSGFVPVTMFFADKLSFYNVPSNVGSIIFKDDNAVWLSGATNSTTTFESPTRVTFTGDLEIIGGNGKFSGATGKVELKGYFNPQDQKDASYETNGVISY